MNDETSVGITGVISAEELVERFPRKQRGTTKSPLLKRFMVLTPGNGLALECCSDTQKPDGCAVGRQLRQGALRLRWRIRQWHGSKNEHIVVRDA